MKITNTHLYDLIVSKRSEEGYYKSYWSKICSCNATYTLNLSKHMLNFEFKVAFENNEKVFRWKLLHSIIPNKILLNRWGIV